MKHNATLSLSLPEASMLEACIRQRRGRAEGHQHEIAALDAVRHKVLDSLEVEGDAPAPVSVTPDEASLLLFCLAQRRARTGNVHEIAALDALTDKITDSVEAPKLEAEPVREPSAPSSRIERLFLVFEPDLQELLASRSADAPGLVCATTPVRMLEAARRGATRDPLAVFGDEKEAREFAAAVIRRRIELLERAAKSLTVGRPS